MDDTLRIVDLVQGVSHSDDSECDDQTADADYGLVNFTCALEATIEEELKDNLEDPSFEVPPENTLIHDK